MCVYGFSIAEDNSPGNDPAYCHLVIRANDDETAMKNSFYNVPCAELSNYVCTGEFSQDGNMILTVDNAEENRRALFPYSDFEFSRGKMADTHISPSFVVRTKAIPYEKPDRVAKRDDIVLEAEEAKPETEQQDGVFLQETSELQASEDSSEDSSENQMECTVFAIEDVPEQPVVDTFQVDANIVDIDQPSDQEQDSPEMVAVAANEQDETNTDVDTDVVEDIVTENVDMDTAEDTAEDVDEVVIGVVVEAVAVDPELEEGQTHENSVIEEDGITNSLATMHHDDDDDDSDEEVTTWTLRKVFRRVRYRPNCVEIGFVIDTLPNGPINRRCALRIYTEDQNPKYASFYDERCDNNGWYLSWGYNSNRDSVVATIESPRRNQKAWFGWDNINANLKNKSLPDNGPNIVHFY